MSGLGHVSTTAEVLTRRRDHMACEVYDRPWPSAGSTANPGFALTRLALALVTHTQGALKMQMLGPDLRDSESVCLESSSAA